MAVVRRDRRAVGDAIRVPVTATVATVTSPFGVAAVAAEDGHVALDLTAAGEWLVDHGTGTPHRIIVGDEPDPGTSEPAPRLEAG